MMIGSVTSVALNSCESAWTRRMWQDRSLALRPVVRASTRSKM